MAEPLEIPTREQAIAEFCARGGAVAAVFPIHYPRALLRAFGLLPVEVWGPPGRAALAGRGRLQAYTCSIVRCGLSFAMEGKLDSAALLLVPHACDSLQGFGSLLLDMADPASTLPPVETFYIPRGRRASDLDFLVRELRRIGGKLIEITGKTVSDSDLLACARREEAADAALAELLAARPRLELSNRRFYELARSREYLPAEAFAPLVRAALAHPGEPRPGPGVVLSGLVPEPMELLDTLDEAGVRVVADDMACCGRRLYPAGSAADPHLRLAQALQWGPPDSTRGCAVQARLDHLLALARRSGARGVLHHDVKFCEPQQFYQPQINQGLASAGLKTLALEVDLADPLPHQVVTRLEAFAEML